LIYGVLALLVAGASGIGGFGGVQTLSPSATVSIISADHRIEFPERIVLTVEVESTFDLLQVQLFYKIAQQETTIYGYPTLSRTPGTVLAEFEIRTRAGVFIPSGVEIEYYYVFRDSRGELFESGRFQVEYLDPQYDWQRMDAGGFELLWHDRPREAVEAVARQVDRGLLPIMEMLGPLPAHPMRAVIVNDRDEANRAFPVISQAATDGHLYGGFAYPDYELFVLSGLSVDGMLHEMTHLLIDDALDSPLARVPAWLNEGLAMYFEGGAGGRPTDVSDASRSGALLSLRNMGAVPGRPSDVRLFYAQSWSIVTYAVATFGPARMSELLAAINSGQRIDEALQTAFGVSIDKLEAQWRASIRSDASFTHLVDPGTLGTSLIIAGAMIAAAAAITVSWIKRVRSVTSPEE
jgi:hypothetical protein